MKKSLLKLVALLTSFVVMFVFNAPVSNSALPSEVVGESAQESVITVADDKDSNFDINEVYKARFLNMLNHNFVYDESFESVEEIVNDSMPALLAFRDSVDEGYISEEIVSDYVFNMYGIDFIDYDAINSEFERIEGKVFILPKGISVYNHEIISVNANEDGSFTVKTNVEISSHDSGSYKDVCETLFVKNELSQFGFSIIYSNIGSQTFSA